MNVRKILLINPPQELDRLMGVGKEFIQKYEPLGLLYIAAVVREAGYEVLVIDAFAEDINIETLKRRIIAIKPSIIGITTFTCNGDVIFELGKWIKKNHSDILVVLGNIHASVFAKQYIENNCCDIVVHGEGEYVFLKIIDYYNGKCALEDIKGISFKNNENIIIQADTSRCIIEDVSKLPFPARDLVKQELYNSTEISNRIFIGGNDNRIKTLITSRGCPQRCSFCVVHAYKKPRYNDPVRVVDEIEILMKEYNISYLLIDDPIFIANKDRILKICSEINKRGLKIKWGCQGHVNYIYPEIIRAMDSAGCYEVSIGIESGVQRLLDRIHKGIKLADVRRTIDIIKNNSDICIEGLFILGLPGEKYEDSVKTIKFAKSLPLDMAQFSILTPFPGSPLFSQLADKGEIDTGVRDDGSIDTAVWKRYSEYICFTKNEPIWVTEGLTNALLRKLQKRALREFYLRPVQIRKHMKRLRLNNIPDILKIAVKGFF